MNRTCDLRFRKPLLYPLSYGGEPSTGYRRSQLANYDSIEFNRPTNASGEPSSASRLAGSSTREILPA